MAEKMTLPPFCADVGTTDTVIDVGTRTIDGWPVDAGATGTGRTVLPPPPALATVVDVVLELVVLVPVVDVVLELVVVLLGLVAVVMYVNLSAATPPLVPAGVVTVTSTVPVPAGDIAVIDEAEATWKLWAGVEPKSTAFAPVNPEPVMVTWVPPPVEPLDGETLMTSGGAAGAVCAAE